MEKKNVIGNGTKTENGNENGSGIGMGTANDLEVSGIKFHYGKREILKGTGFCARRGEVCLLLGANGAVNAVILAVIGNIKRGKNVYRIAKMIFCDLLSFSGHYLQIRSRCRG